MPKCPNKGPTPGPTELPLPASTGSFIGQGTGTGKFEYLAVNLLLTFQNQVFEYLLEVFFLNSQCW
jgi:hypothetical protein